MFWRNARPHVQGRCEHKLIDRIIITIYAVICGADSWTGVETFGKAKQNWLKQYLALPNGIPSHDTFGRGFAKLDAKAVRRSHDRAIGQDAIHMVSAWASQNGIALGQRKVDDKSNEITAIPELLLLLDVSGCIVAIDARGCQKAIAQAIRDAKADYVLQVKDNQSNLCGRRRRELGCRESRYARIVEDFSVD